MEKRANELDYVFVDTPGQIEIFTWSASGAIITEAFASTFPTIITYMVDTPRSTNPVTFMSNMLYACSILYKTRLPLLLVFNKIDVAQHQFAVEVGSIIYKMQQTVCSSNLTLWVVRGLVLVSVVYLLNFMMLDFLFFVCHEGWLWFFMCAILVTQ